MKPMSIAFITVLSLATTIGGCKKNAAEGGDATCATVVPKMVEMRGNEMVHRLPADKQDKWKGKLSETLLAACTEDKWPADGLACAMNAKDRKEFETTCRPKMGPDYMRKMIDRMRPMIQEMNKDMAPAAVPPAVPGAPTTAGAPAGNTAPTPLPVPPPPAPVTPGK